MARRQAIADETAAKARAAKAEAEVKAAEAARLEQRAGEHRSSVEASREDLDERRAHADSIRSEGEGRQERQRSRRHRVRRDTADDGFVTTTKFTTPTAADAPRPQPRRRGRAPDGTAGSPNGVTRSGHRHRRCRSEHDRQRRPPPQHAGVAAHSRSGAS